MALSKRAIAVLGVGQCVNWGVLYYAFSVLVVPVQRDLGADITFATFPFSLALLMSAVLAPTVGAWSDRGYGPQLMTLGASAAATLLLGWAAWPTAATFYLAWLGLGCCMAATLYEPAFIIVGRAASNRSDRLRTLALVTLFGGLASTVFMPSTALLVEAVGWRLTVCVLAMVLLAAVAVTHVAAFRRLPAATETEAAAPQGVTNDASPSLALTAIATTFAWASLAGAGLTSNLVPAFGERGITPTTAAMLGGLVGVMQLPGRAMLLRGHTTHSPARLLLMTLVFQAVGMAILAIGPSITSLATGMVIFALGSGLSTLVRPHLVQTLFGLNGSGIVNGRIARQQQLARAAGPIAVASVAGAFSYALVFAATAGVFLILALATRGILAATTLTFERSHHD